MTILGSSLSSPEEEDDRVTFLWNWIKQTNELYIAPYESSQACTVVLVLCNPSFYNIKASKFKLSWILSCKSKIHLSS